MKLPFSYKHHFFGSALSLSLMGHSFLITLSGTFLPSPQFSVVQAPSSIELDLEPRQELPKEDAVQFRVIAIEDSGVLTKREIRQPKESDKEQKKREPVPATTKPPAETLIEKGAAVEFAQSLKANPAPEYPMLARQKGWEGLVLLKVVVEKDGHPIEINVVSSSGYKILDLAARRALAKWSFIPARLGNLSFRSQIKIPVRFVLDETV